MPEEDESAGILATTPTWPRLKEDGILGPKTRRATKMAAGSLGNGLLRGLDRLG